MFLHEHVDLQIAALYAAQVFCYTHGFPKGKGHGENVISCRKHWTGVYTCIDILFTLLQEEKGGGG